MPIYVYRYDDTEGGEHETFEVFQKMSDDALKTHDGRPVARVPQGVGVSTGFKPFVSRSLDKNHPHAPHLVNQCPAFQNKRELDEFMAKNNNDPNTENLAWDG